MRENDWFFDKFDKEAKATGAKLILVWLLLLVINIAIIAGLIILGAWAIGTFIV